MRARRAIAMLWLFTLPAPAMAAQRPTPPLPSGNRIVAQDGDVVVVEDDARVRIVRRREVYVRAVFNAQERWLVLLLDQPAAGEPADGRVDWTYHFRDVEGVWPLGARWEGAATIEEYSMAARGATRSGGLGITTSQGLVQLLALALQQEFRDRNAVAVLQSNGYGSGGANKLGFDEAERWLITQVRRNDGVMDMPAGGSMSVRTGLSFDVDRSDAVRVGGSVRSPVKIVDVPPVMPESAARAGIRGIVIVEITIDVDGTVKDARVLRSIPMLDAAALEAVRQWRYDPATIAGKPVIMTVSVAF